MAFLKRVFGAAGSKPKPEGQPEPAAGSTAADEAPEDEEARELELLRAEAMRLDNDLLQRQLRYVDRSWVPPREGGDRRADDADRATGEG